MLIVSEQSIVLAGVCLPPSTISNPAWLSHLAAQRYNLQPKTIQVSPFASLCLLHAELSAAARAGVGEACGEMYWEGGYVRPFPQSIVSTYLCAILCST